jgi:4-amino-4-deoxy-L-arabinose transferase-like glycosyltransferase
MAALTPQSQTTSRAARHRPIAGRGEQRALPARRLVAIAAAAAVAIVLLGQGISAPFDKDQEPQSAQWIVDIVQNGHWLIPHDYYGNVDRKPPLFYWLSALATMATGGHVDEVRARLIPLVAGATLAVGVMLWSAAWLDEATGWLAFFFLLGTYGFASRATLALTDMLLTLLLFSAFCVLYPVLEGRESRWRTVAAGVILGFGILTKGPLALVLCAFAIFIYLLLARRRPWRLLGRPWPWIILAIASVIAAAWYVPAFIVGGHNLIDVFMAENFGHFAPADMGGTGEAARPIYYIAARMFGGAMPLSFLVPALIVAFFAGRMFDGVRKPVLFQLALLLAVVLLFSAASAKRDDYILPALPSLAILLAALFRPPGGVPEAGAEQRADYAAGLRDITVALAGAGMLIALAAILLARSAGIMNALHIRLQSSDASYAAMLFKGMDRLDPPFAALIVATAIGAAVIFVALYRRSTMWSGTGLAVLAIAGVALWNSTLRPEFARTRTLKQFAAEIHQRIGDAPLYIVAGEKPGLSYYYGRGVPAIGPRVRPGLATSQPVYIFARKRELGELAPEYRKRLKMVLQAHTLGGGGPPAVYMLTPLGMESASGRKRLQRSNGNIGAVSNRVELR